MQGDEARLLLGFPPNSRPTPSQIKAAYRKKVWESHPDLFPVHEKRSAESKFKLIAEAYTCLQSDLCNDLSSKSKKAGYLRDMTICSFIISFMVATTWDKLLRAAKNCHKRAMVYMFVNQISMLGSVLDDDWLVEAEKQAMQEDEEITYNDVQQFYGDDMDELNSVTIDDDSLDFLDDGSTD
ncbi:Protein CAJ1 [Gossypium arboreum]|uniref:Protein CAJ1 n=1 Tax=Gossypium arboreum TaxID=29729 RepID=A0A0B0Q2C4_GOSAR|nr:Protein CAJ1 [Gossypium arboreum]